MAPTCVPSLYHQSLRGSFICKGNVVPTDRAKLMMLFQPKLGWSLLELLDLSADSGCWAPLQK